MELQLYTIKFNSWKRSFQVYDVSNELAYTFKPRKRWIFREYELYEGNIKALDIVANAFYNKGKVLYASKVYAAYQQSTWMTQTNINIIDTERIYTMKWDDFRGLITVINQDNHEVGIIRNSSRNKQKALHL